MRWVARQLRLLDNTRLDLLGLTPDDEWVVIELKRGPVDASTLTQALHYALLLGPSDLGSSWRPSGLVRRSSCCLRRISNTSRSSLRLSWMMIPVGSA